METKITYTATAKLGRAKVTPDIVRKIRKEYSQGERQVFLAKKYGIAQPNISRIITRKAWAFVEDLPESE